MEFERRRDPDYTQFLKVLRREGRPDHLPFYEHIASSGFIANRTKTAFDQWSPDHPDYWKVYVDFWIGLGFDVVPLEIAPNWVLESHEDSSGKASHGSEATVTIRNMAEFERYAWPDEDAPLTFEHFERAAECLPEGAKIVGGVCGGPYEWSTQFLGVQGLAIAICMDPELVEAFYNKLMAIYTGALKRLAKMDFICALRQGDDLGYKTSTFLAPEHLRRYVFPIYKEMADIAHGAGKPFILHSCGNLADVYEDLIEYCRIDAKHSFEDVILPVVDFKRQYGHRITPLGGLDVDRICRSDEADLRRYVREVAEVCFADGYWAMGTGNSLTNYMPVENYLVVADEAMGIA
jgi:uroporphyrinogen decarboxylase